MKKTVADCCRYSFQSNRSPYPTAARDHRVGGIVVLLLVAMPVILGFFVLMVNTSWMQLSRTELRVATDAAVGAGVYTLGNYGLREKATAAAQQAAQKNLVAGEPLLLADTDVKFGISSPDSTGLWQFVEQTVPDDPVNSVRVTGRRVAGSPSGPVPMLFNGMFKFSGFEPAVSGAATLDGRQYVLVLDYSASMMFPMDFDDFPASWPEKKIVEDRTLGSTIGDENFSKIHLSRWTAMKIAVHAFLDALEETPENEIVSMGFIGSYRGLAATGTYQSLRDAMKFCNFRGGSNIALGMYKAAAPIIQTAPSTSRRMLLITDAHYTNGPWSEKVAQKFREKHNFDVHVIAPGALSYGYQLARFRSYGSTTHRVSTGKELQTLMKSLIITEGAVPTVRTE